MRKLFVMLSCYDRRSKNLSDLYCSYIVVLKSAHRHRLESMNNLLWLPLVLHKNCTPKLVTLHPSLSHTHTHTVQRKLCVHIRMGPVWRFTTPPAGKSQLDILQK